VCDVVDDILAVEADQKDGADGGTARECGDSYEKCVVRQHVGIGGPIGQMHAQLQSTGTVQASDFLNIRA
jgi:hypothetical protein